MSQFTTEVLLTYSPLEALLILINERLQSNLHPSGVAVTDVQAVDASRARVTLTALPSADRLEAQEFVNSGTVVLNRLDPATIFGPGYTLPLVAPVMTADILGYITQHTGIVFAEDDFIYEVHDGTEITLRVNPQSLRWCANFSLNIQSSYVSIAERLPNRALTGLAIPYDLYNPIANTLTVTLLDGLKLPQSLTQLTTITELNGLEVTDVALTDVIINTNLNGLAL